MKSWLNPIPAETVIGAIVGAVLGSILERDDYLTIPTWMQSFFALQFIFLIVAFGICAHFYCAAALLKKEKIKSWSRGGCALVIFLILFIYPKHLGIGEDASINFTPHPYNALMSGVLILWVAALRILTQVKRIIGE
jgi:hypothetical protein